MCLRWQETGETHRQAPGGSRQPKALWPRGQRAGQRKLQRREVLLGGGGRGQGRVEPGCGQTVNKQKGEVHSLPCKWILDSKPQDRGPIHCQHLSCHLVSCGTPPEEGGHFPGLHRGTGVLLLCRIWRSYPHLHGHVYRQAGSIFQSRPPAWWQERSTANDLFEFL